MAKKKPRPGRFSVVKAVKANARERVGQPKPERVIEAPPSGNSRKGKYKPTFQDLLEGE